MELDKTIKLGMLLDIYGDLLTPKMREMLSMYVYENMTYQEIADVYKISKPAVLDAIKKAENKLNFYENTIKKLDFKQKALISLESDELEKFKNLLKEF